MKELDSSNFDSTISSGVTLVDFWAAWCGPCKMLMPVIEQIAAEVEGKAVVAKVNVDENRDLAARYMVTTIPALFVFKDGEIVSNASGVQSKGKILEMINSCL